MKLFRISQDANNGCDTYDSAIVAASDAEAARAIHPNGSDRWDGWSPSWAPSLDQVSVEYIGEAADNVPAGVVLASFNAG